MNIVKALTSNLVFRPLFRDLESWQSWFVFLKALFGVPIINPSERKLFRTCTGLKRPPARRVREAYVIAGRRSGKSYISSVIAVYLACFKDWSEFLSPGERGHIFIIATDKTQATIIKGYISGVLHSNRTFERMIKRETQECIDLNNRVSIMIKVASYRSLRGFTLLACILEELAFWRDEQSANPDKEILNAVRPALATIPDSLLIGISTPYSRSGVLWEMYRSHYGKSEKEAPLIWRAETSVMNPTVSKKLIDNALKEDYSGAQAEWLARFREDVSSFLSLELIESAVIPGRFELPKLEGIRYFGFCDPSGGRQDSMTLAISHKDSTTGKTVLDVLRESRPPFVPNAVVQAFSEVLKEYDVTQIQADRYAGEWVSSAFRDNGIMVESAEQSASEFYLALLPLLANGSIELLDDKRLTSQLRSLERRTRSGGKDSISHYPGGHDDVANAVAGACIMASAEAFPLPPPSLGLVDQHEHKSMEEEAIVWLMGEKPTKKKARGELDFISDEKLLEELDEDKEERKSEAEIKHGW